VQKCFDRWFAGRKPMIPSQFRCIEMKTAMPRGDDQRFQQ
jgi:hypothetical protein